MTELIPSNTNLDADLSQSGRWEVLASRVLEEMLSIVWRSWAPEKRSDYGQEWKSSCLFGAAKLLEKTKAYDSWHWSRTFLAGKGGEGVVT